MNIKQLLKKLALPLVLFTLPSTTIAQVPDASVTPLSEVKSWAFLRVLQAQQEFANSGIPRDPSPGFWGDKVVYQIMVDRFNDGDPSNNRSNIESNQQQFEGTANLWDLPNWRSGGDIKGIQQRLPYLKDLGVTAIWLTPVFKHNGSYHGYCTTDFTQIDPGFGTKEELREMVKVAHEHGIKVVLDIVVNHMCDPNTFYSTPARNPFNDGRSGLHACADDLNARDWSGASAESPAQGTLNFSNNFFGALKNNAFFNRCGANSHSDMAGSGPAAVYGDFVSTMFDFNTRNHDFQDIFGNLHKYWIAYADIDGFRMDAAKHITGDFIAHFSTQMRSYAKSIGKDNFYIIGEVAAGEDFIGQRLGKMSRQPIPQSTTNRKNDMQPLWSQLGQHSYPGLSAVYDFAFSGRSVDAIRGNRPLSWISDAFIDGYYNTITANADARLSWNLLEIHDWPRFTVGGFKNNPFKSAGGISFLTMAQGSPIIYYGMEQGFNGDCHFNTMNAGQANGNIQSLCSLDQTTHDPAAHPLYRQDMFMTGKFRLGSTVPEVSQFGKIGNHNDQAPSDWRVDPYLNRNHFVYKTARRFNYLRRSCSALSFGWTKHRFANSTSSNGIYAFSRIDNGKEALVIFNNSSNTMTIPNLSVERLGVQYVNMQNGLARITPNAGATPWLPFADQGWTINGNSVLVFVPADNVGPWRDYLGTHVCNDNPLDPKDPAQSNMPPVANAGADKTVSVGAMVTFDGSGSNDPDGAIFEHRWSSTAFSQDLIGASPSFTFNTPGTFTVKLTVTDGNGAKAEDTMTVTVSSSNNNWKRTLVFIFGETQTGQDMFIRGGIDHAQAKTLLGLDCTQENKLCSIPIRHLNFFNGTTAPWKQNDTVLDWHGAEPLQNQAAQGTPLDWTTNLWPSNWGPLRTYEQHGAGQTPLNIWGHHYWLLEVEMDCSRTVNGWFELKSFISNGPGWEANVTQPGAPYVSGNHFAQCGKLNTFRRGQSNPVVIRDL